MLLRTVPFISLHKYLKKKMSTLNAQVQNYVRMHAYARAYVCAYARAYACIRMRMHTCIRTCVRMRMHVHTHVRIVHTHVHTHDTHVHTHTKLVRMQVHTHVRTNAYAPGTSPMSHRLRLRTMFQN